ncbi:MAG: PH domain-containing protein [Acidimicrobiia bacterium]
MWTASGFEPLPAQALSVRRARSGFSIVAVALVLIAIDIGLRLLLDVEVNVAPLLIPGAIVLVLIASWWPWTRLSWRAWGWRIDESTFQTRSGVYTKVWKGVPRDRVQFVEVTAGPLQRSAGLATLVVRTAGVRTPAVNVEDLEADVAERLRSTLSPQSTPEAGKSDATLSDD